MKHNVDEWEIETGSDWVTVNHPVLDAPLQLQSKALLVDPSASIDIRRSNGAVVGTITLTDTFSIIRVVKPLCNDSRVKITTINAGGMRNVTLEECPMDLPTITFTKYDQAVHDPFGFTIQSSTHAIDTSVEIVDGKLRIDTDNCRVGTPLIDNLDITVGDITILYHAPTLTINNDKLSQTIVFDTVSGYATISFISSNGLPVDNFLLREEND